MGNLSCYHHLPKPAQPKYVPTESLFPSQAFHSSHVICLCQLFPQIIKAPGQGSSPPLTGCQSEGEVAAEPAPISRQLCTFCGQRLLQTLPYCFIHLAEGLHLCTCYRGTASLTDRLGRLVSGFEWAGVVAESASVNTWEYRKISKVLKGKMVVGSCDILGLMHMKHCAGNFFPSILNRVSENCYSFQGRQWQVSGFRCKQASAVCCRPADLKL